jgi:hypothetical protein
METNTEVRVISVRVKVLATAAYAAIEASTPQDGGFASIDVKLAAGTSAPVSLRESARQYEKEAARLMRYAKTCALAADALEKGRTIPVALAEV